MGSGWHDAGLVIDREKRAGRSMKVGGRTTVSEWVDLTLCIDDRIAVHMGVSIDWKRGALIDRWYITYMDLSSYARCWRLFDLNGLFLNFVLFCFKWEICIGFDWLCGNAKIVHCIYRPTLQLLTPHWRYLLICQQSNVFLQGCLNAVSGRLQRHHWLCFKHSIGFRLDTKSHKCLCI